MKIFVFPGTFDPITNGHKDIVDRALKICDKLIIAVYENNIKMPFFSIEERVEMIKKVIGKRNNVEVEKFSGLLSQFVKEKNADFVIKGLRNNDDYEYEMQMAHINKRLNKNLDTLFLISSEENVCISSKVVKEITLNGGDVSKFVDGCVELELKKKLNK